MQENHIQTTLEVSPDSPDSGCPQDVSEWYALRVTYGRELKLDAELDELGIKHFLPLKTVHYNRKSDGKLMKKQVSAIPNLIFVYSTRTYIQELKQQLSATIPIRYFMDRTTREPLIVPKRQMEDFIRLAGDGDDNLIYLDNPDIIFEKGQPVEVVYGPFAGIQGYVLRIRRDRKVVLVLNGLIAAAIKAEIKMDWVKKIDSLEA